MKTPEQDIVVGLQRLRKCAEEGTFRPELLPKTNPEDIEGGCSIVRELHVYETAVPVHERDPTKFQHQGFGTLFMEKAERIGRDVRGSIKIAVISGVGMRDYYRKLGYELDGVAPEEIPLDVLEDSATHITHLDCLT
ncbi:hypothetical protein M422DRAFT_276655 [Sphaerobolus stellatus SS14]|uniref:N-acetyltransferase domain-containing protein n=1 Tax=Sphaerobolus stellatus (strain SS14) TaxID=990650 RepID=A0A0C9TLZ1_SPHS4|nr:hypothetical protein M422DRAFT_276655 [Sphaerobolus stellatus SS14]